MIAVPQDFIDYIGTTPCDATHARGDCCRVHECWFGNPGNAYRAGYAKGAHDEREECAKIAEEWCGPEETAGGASYVIAAAIRGRKA